MKRPTLESIESALNRPEHSGGRYISTVFFLLLVLVLGGGIVLTFSPPEMPRGVGLSQEFDETSLLKSLNHNSLAATCDQIQMFGPRGLGQPGHAKTALFLAEELRAAGLDVIERRDTVVAPVTEQSEILGSDNHPIPGVTLHPFFPNLFQPIVTPPGGLCGELLLLDEKTIRSRESFVGIIGVVDLDAPPEAYGFDWSRYAQLGIEGLILASRRDAPPEWRPLWENNTMISTIPVNFLRATANSEIFSHLGKNVKVRLSQKYEAVENTSIVARLTAKNPTSEALVITGHYDTYGLIPGMSQGNLQALSPAMILSLARGLSPYRESLLRDILFVLDGAEMMGGIGEASVVSAFGPANFSAQSGRRLLAEAADNATSLEYVEKCLDIASKEGFLVDPVATKGGRDSLDSGTLAFFNDQLRTVLNGMVFDATEGVLQAKINIERKDAFVTSGPEFEALQAALSEYNKTLAVSGTGLANLAENQSQFLIKSRLRERMIQRFEKLKQFHQHRKLKLASDAAINQLGANYRAMLVLSPRLLPSDKAGKKSGLALLTGDSTDLSLSTARKQGPHMSALFLEEMQAKNFRDRLDFAPLSVPSVQIYSPSVANMPVNSRFWNRFSYPAFTLVNTDRLQSYRALTLPGPQQVPSDLSSMTDSLACLGHMVLSISHGAGQFVVSERPQQKSFSGLALASGVGQSVVPSYPLEGALVGCKISDEVFRNAPGHYRHPLLLTNPYGRYELLGTPASFLPPVTTAYSPQAFVFDDNGRILWAKDESESTIYKSQKLPLGTGNLTNVHLVLFRGDPVTFLDLTNPQSMQPYASVSLLTRSGLSAFAKSNTFTESNAFSAFIQPENFFYAAMRAGEPDNPLVQSIRGFLLGPAPATSGERFAGISGVGYLAADMPLFHSIAQPMSESMLRVNKTRADLQQSRHMLDNMISQMIQRSDTLFQASREAGAAYLDRVLLARQSAGYSTIVHPILRSNITNAVISILWYLGLLVPFVFFFEKLVFGFADIRKQLAAQAVIFLIVFGLLRVMHPAFEMIRSSLMILLGFIILLIAGGVTLLFTGKFKENLEALKSLRGKAAGSGVNTMGIIATAFMLGLNNMHRRKVRTGLTCATLVLITFAMIAFTSVRSDLVESETALGPAAYQGLLVKKDKGAAISPSEIFALQTRYSNRFPVSIRSYYTGVRNPWTQESANPVLEIRSTSGQGRGVRFLSMLQFDHTEPLRDRISLLTSPYWFPAKGEMIPGQPLPVLIPDSMAQELGLTVEKVNGNIDVNVSINGSEFRVAGIFEAKSLNALRDLDGNSLLPPDITAIPNVRVDGSGAPLAEPGDPRISAESVVLLPQVPSGISLTNSARRNASATVGLGDLGYRPAKELVVQYLELAGTGAFYGLDGVAYFGKRIQENSFQGLLDMIMPLVIAALTVLNTMKGSVYERRDEIYVYNAVGIAPRYIFFMFFAEAFVYSVVGAVLGYLLAQGTGYILTTAGLTGGLNMTFAGPNTILASLAVIAAVFFSTIFPALTAVQIAAPSEDAGWRMPEPEGDTFYFNLPFTFNPYDRIAVLAFFNRFLVDHGEGGSGPFHAGPPVWCLEGEESDPTPSLHATIWLKPYDLGVSQNMIISLPLDAETREYVARITIERLSGTKDSWRRLNRSLTGRVRSQFLHWRAVSPAQKVMFYSEACAAMSSQASQDNPEMMDQTKKESHV